ncbi:hypothetical protein H5410_013452 [Solanum commersonii]|uniref:DUF4283 domain-containing protein n=1 Tax=Solanum commersonii TaxID=4109 RepID=A0A9J6AVG1_SOLCO|nr:hypothetical protein H5410_013452 [Solanum commersonii]
MAASPSPQPMVVGEKNANPNTARIKQYTEKSVKPVSLLHGESMVVFDSKDLETPELPDLRKILPQQLGFKGECNIGLLESRHVLLRFTLKEDYIAIFSKTSRSIKFAGTVIPFRIQKWTPSFSPMEETSIAMAWISFPSLPCQYFARNALFSMALAVGQPLDVDRATNDKTRPSTARVKVEGHREADCQTLTDGQVDATVSENHIEGEKFQGHLRVHLNAKKADSNRLEVGEKDDEGTIKDLEIGTEKSGVKDQNLVHQNSSQRLGKAVLDDYSSGNRMLSLIPQTDELSRQKNISPNQQSCNSADHVEVEEQLIVDTNQSNDAQFAQKINEIKENEVAAENSIEISSRDENATGNWNTIAQKKSISMCIGSSASRSKSPCLENKQQLTTNVVVQSNEPKDIVCTNPFEALEVEKELELADSNPTKEQTLVRLDFDNNIQSVSTPTGNNEQEALASEVSPTRGYDSDLGNDSFNEDEEENMLDVCFDKVARDGDIPPRYQRSGSNKNKKKTYGRQHSWDGKVTREFVPRHLPMRLAKQNHTTVPIASTRSNTSKKK